MIALAVYSENTLSKVTASDNPLRTSTLRLKMPLAVILVSWKQDDCWAKAWIASEHSGDKRSAVGRERSRVGRVTPSGRLKLEASAINANIRRNVVPLAFMLCLQIDR